MVSRFFGERNERNRKFFRELLCEKIGLIISLRNILSNPMCRDKTDICRSVLDVVLECFICLNKQRQPLCKKCCDIVLMVILESEN